MPARARVGYGGGTRRRRDSAGDPAWPFQGKGADPSSPDALADAEGVDRLLAVLVDSLPALISYVDADQRYRWVNRTYEATFGRARDDIVGRRVVEVLGEPGYAFIRPHLERALAGEAVEWEATIDVGGGVPRHAHYVPHRDADGTVQGCFVLVTDVSLLRRGDEARRRTERLAALGTLAAGIAHEVSNPAASILATAQLGRTLLDAPDAREALGAALEKIAAEAARCGRIVHSVLAFADQGPTERRAHDLNVVVARAVDLVRAAGRSRDVALRFAPAADLPAVDVNDSELTQVVINLLDNAVRAGSRRIVVSTEARPHEVALIVTDDGAGIPPEDLSRVFDPFFTTRAQRGGTGLGLSISYGIVTRHGGILHIDSAAGRGTTVSALLPIGAAAPC